MDQFDLRWANRMCSELDCGTALSVKRTRVSGRNMATIRSTCEQSELVECVEVRTSVSSLGIQLNCSDFVRLIHGPRLCSGALQIYWDRSWTSVCAENFDLHDAQVVCRELGCGAPSVLQGALSGQDPLGKTFYCEGDESALMDCPRSSSVHTCSNLFQQPGKLPASGTLGTPLAVFRLWPMKLYLTDARF
ncbi:hypothetical protein WMY93_034390 [Mugilogobius chulae]|uniref:SRCR domain-containing protein n=1 Tax=Mugilogobius chulae TaxID=88201 RepID=A0AAW0MN79_9GOBI